MMVLIILMILAIVLFIILIKYNEIIAQKNKVKQAKSGIDIYLNQRFDLIPNLVECVKVYSKHEKDLIENITKTRSEYMVNKSLGKAEKLNNNMNKLVAVAENYPELKASEQYLNLQKNLTKIESQLQAARRIYNSEVTKYNTIILKVPTNIIAHMFNFKEEELFEIEEFKRENINMNLEG